MKQSTYIQLKAFFLLAVFGLNTAVGFACAIGVDMGFNTAHHHDDEASEIHVHANGEKHEHHAKTASHHHEENNEQPDNKGGCCNDSVINISQSDKSVPHSNIITSPVFFIAFVATYYNIEIYYSSQVSISNKYFVLGHHPPIRDVRIAIQSFQI